MTEQNCFATLENAFANQIQQRPTHAARLDRIQHAAFAAFAFPPLDPRASFKTVTRDRTGEHNRPKQSNS